MKKKKRIKKASEQLEKEIESMQEAEERAEKVEEKKKKIIEIITAFFLGVAAFLSAWSTWIGSLHAGLQAIHFTEANSMAAEAGALFNQDAQLFLRDVMSWESIMNYTYDAQLALEQGNTQEYALLEAKADALIENFSTDEFGEAIQWAIENNKSPFEKEGFADSYFKDANEWLAISNAKLEEGKQDNKNGDTYGLVTVIYSIVLFLLGIANIFKNFSNRVAVVCIAVGFCAFGFIFMLTIPMPTGFDLFSYLETFVK